ncbi:MAG: S8 family serine peptidase, partial [Pyrinomonadaceae bacterium]
MKRSLLFFLAMAFLWVGLPSGLISKQGIHAQSGSASDGANKVSKDLVEKLNDGQGTELVRVIIQPETAWDSTLANTVELAGGANVHQFENFSLRMVTLPVQAAVALATRSDISYVSLNREVRTLGHLSNTTGADAVRTSSGTTTGRLDGAGIGIAILDSGIYGAHKSFLDRSNNSRIVVSEDFTGEGRTDDPYGHGTHVASLAAGNGRISHAQYRGIA